MREIFLSISYTFYLYNLHNLHNLYKYCICGIIRYLYVIPHQIIQN
jgi:hypothetical protein